MQLFFTEEKKEQFTLPKKESKHIIKSLRKKEGDILHFTDGKGMLMTGYILHANHKETIVNITNKISKKKTHPGHIHIAISPTKNINRFEFFLEKATEIGVDEITPIICERSERRSVKRGRCHRILISAMKQSLKCHLPKMNEIILLTEFLKKDIAGNKYIAHLSEEARKELRNEKKSEQTTILIGPEGDFSKIEIKTSIENNYKAVSLGNSRLRTETAGITAVNIINIIN